ncbi:hypothetical protein CR513_23137, partial [Mucuna pruriens]
MPTVARHLISNMASNTQQFGIRGVARPIPNVRKLAMGQHQSIIVARVYGICTSMEHPTYMCPTLQETESDHLESVGSIVVPAESESRAIPSSKIRTRLEHASKSKQLSVKSEIPTTIVPTTTTIKSVTTRQLTISGGPDEAVGYKQPGVSA